MWAIAGHDPCVLKYAFATNNDAATFHILCKLLQFLLSKCIVSEGKDKSKQAGLLTVDRGILKYRVIWSMLLL